MKTRKKNTLLIAFAVLLLLILVEPSVDNEKSTLNAAETLNTIDINIEGKQQAIYECDVNYGEGDKIGIKIVGDEGSGTLFELGDSIMRIGDKKCEGTFETGEYQVKIYINPLQKSVQVEVTRPNGGVIRRGSHAFLYDSTTITQITSKTNKANVVTEETVTYSDINLTEYALNETEPQYAGFEENVYNLVTSFDDAKTTRNFAWTAKASYIGVDGVMSVKYKQVDDADWTSVDAEREVEKTDIEEEDFFKADITDLEPGTTYEYKIGKKESDDETNDWSQTYTFTTEGESVSEFSFIAVGDTQGQNWDGDYVNSVGQKGFKYTQEAIEQAVADAENPAFMLHTGDVVEAAAYEEQWNYYFKALGDIGKTIPHFVAVGNHDTYVEQYENSPFYFDLHFNHPNNGGSAAFAEGVTGSVYDSDFANALMNNADETVYSFDYGNAHITVLNSGIYEDGQETDKTIIEGQRAWLEADLESNEDAVWKIIMVHQAVYARLGATEDRSWLHDVIEEYGVDLVIQGHSHLVTRTYPMKDGEVVTNTVTDTIEKGSGTVYTTIGATTLNHDKLTSNIVDKFITVFTPDSAQPTYTVATVNDEELKVTIKQINGLVVDEFTITSNAVPTETEIEPLMIAVVIIVVFVGVAVAGVIVWRKRRERNV